MAVIGEPERSRIYTRIKHQLGAPLRSVELEDEMLDSLMELSIQDYTQYTLDWLIESQWVNLVNLNMDEKSVAKALVTRTMDFEDQFTYAYSKIVGLQTSGPWVLKKDYINLSANTQNYVIPKGREVNEVLWFTPAEMTSGLFNPWGGGFAGAPGLGGGSGYAQMGYQGSYLMTSGFDMLLRLQEVNILNRIYGGDLTYRITGLPDGERLLQLYNVPGGRFDWGTIGYNNYRVWYWYYDTEGKDRDACLKANPDIIKLPSDVPLETLEWEDLNVPAQQWVRRWFTAYSKETLARVRGKYSGNLKTPDSEITMDYQSLLTEAKDEKSKLEEELKLRLERLRPEKVMEREALLAENLNKQMKFRAFPRQIYVI
jgi:hypothetical protein